MPGAPGPGGEVEAALGLALAAAAESSKLGAYLIMEALIREAIRGNQART